jgi:mannan endo-1,4-beta-mannosidase
MKGRTVISLLISIMLFNSTVITIGSNKSYAASGDGIEYGDSIRPREDEFVRVEGLHFILKNKRFRFVGSNTYYLMYTSQKNIDQILENSSRMNLRVIRTWVFGEGENFLQTAPGIYREEVLQTLDYILVKANELGLKLILTLVNNWKDYGGMNQYVQWSDTARNHNDFYTDGNCRIWFKNHVSTIINRKNTINGKFYKEETTIFAWELTNEARAPGDQSGNVLQDWIDEMSTYIKTIDPNHLVTTGLEGFYRGGPRFDWRRNGSQGTDFVSNHKVPAVDFAVFHLWPEHWHMNLQESIAWIREHIEKAHSIINKPIILEEFGKKRDEALSITTRDEFYEATLDIVYKTNTGGVLFWAHYHDDYPDYDGYGIYIKDRSTTEIIKNFANKMTTY